MEGLATLQRENDRLKAEKQAWEAEKRSLEARNAQQAHELDMLKRLLYGAKRERFAPGAAQGQLPLPFEGGQPEQRPAEQTEKIAYERRKPQNRNHPGRNAFPAHLPRRTTVVEPGIDTTGMAHVGDEVTEELEYTPATLVVHRIVRPKYSMGKEEGVAVAPMPDRPVPKCVAAPSLLAFLTVAKFVDALPIHRILEIFKREGVKIAASTANGWQEAIYRLLWPLYRAMKAQVLAEGYLQADETSVKAIRKGRGKAATGYHWVYYAPIRKAVLFDYRPGRGREGPKAMLAGFRGYLQTDGYKAYDSALEGNPGVVRVACMAHIRRYFEQALDSDGARAGHALREIQKLYAVERQARENGLSPQQRHALRLDKALPVANALGKWVAAEYGKTLPKSPMGKALAYAAKRWGDMLNYFADGALEIDNNWVENKIRPVAVGRKNYLFVGADHGGERAALFYSFMATCKANGVNPYKWLKYTLENLPSCKVNDIDKFLPYNIDPNLLD